MEKYIDYGYKNAIIIISTSNLANIIENCYNISCSIEDGGPISYRSFSFAILQFHVSVANNLNHRVNTRNTSKLILEIYADGNDNLS